MYRQLAAAALGFVRAAMVRKRKIIAYIATSADGFIARPDGSVDWLDRPRPKGNYGMGAFYKSIDTVLWGRKTYDLALEFQKKGVAEAAFDSRFKNYIFSKGPRPLNIPSGVEFDIGGQLLPELVRNGQSIFGITLPFAWLDIGSVPDYWEATGLLLRGKVAGFTMPGNEVRPGVHCGINVQIAWDRVRIEGPVYIGSSTSVGDGATIIGPTVIGSGCVIQPGATLRECILADYTRISSVAVLEQKLVFGSKCIDPSGKYLDIEESQIRWLVDDARNKEELSESELLLFEEVKNLPVS